MAKNGRQSNSYHNNIPVEKKIIHILRGFSWWVGGWVGGCVCVCVCQRKSTYARAREGGRESLQN